MDQDNPEDRRGGRPPLADADRRNHRLDIMLTEAEWTLVHQAAGMIPVRVWARNELIRAAQRATKPQGS